MLASSPLICASSPPHRALHSFPTRRSSDLQSGGGPKGVGPPFGEGCGSPERPRGPRGRAAGSDPLILEPLACDSERRACPFFPVPMLVQDRCTGTRPRPLEPHDRLRVVAPHAIGRAHV